MRTLLLLVAVLAVGSTLACSGPPNAVDDGKHIVGGDDDPSTLNSKGTVLIDETAVLSLLTDFNRSVGWRPLGSHKRSKGETEMRLWVSFGTDKLECVQLRHRNGKWDGMLITITDATPKSTKTTLKVTWKKLNEPKLSFVAVIAKLETLGVRVPLEFGYDSLRSVPIPDEGQVLFEINDESGYSSVGYRQFTESNDGKRMLTVCRTIASEFRIALGCAPDRSD